MRLAPRITVRAAARVGRKARDLMDVLDHMQARSIPCAGTLLLPRRHLKEVGVEGHVVPDLGNGKTQSYNSIT